MTVRMLLRKVKLENLLSFRKTEVELRGLNVLIGANASGKSNLIEAIGLLQAAPVDLSTAILRLGGVRVVCSLAGPVASPIAAIECTGIDGQLLQYRLEFSEEARGFAILREQLNAIAGEQEAFGIYFARTPGNVLFGSSFGKHPDMGAVPPGQSVLALYKNPADPTPTTRVGRQFAAIRIFREFRTVGDSQTRRGVSTSTPKDFLDDSGDN